MAEHDYNFIPYEPTQEPIFPSELQVKILHFKPNVVTEFTCKDWTSLFLVKPDSDSKK